MANQYSKLTRANAVRKMNRKSNPVTTVTQMAREFGYNVDYIRMSDWYGRYGQQVAAPSEGVRNKIRATIGEDNYRILATR